MKHAFIERQRATHRVDHLCAALGVSRSGYYAGRSRPESRRAQANRTLLLQIRRLHAESREAYGAVKTWRTLTEEGVPCGRHRVRRLRRAHGIEARRMRRFRAAYQARNNEPPAPHHLDRQFDVPAPNRVWAGDITFIPTRRGWLYLAVLLDLYSRRVIGWATYGVRHLYFYILTGRSFSGKTAAWLVSRASIVRRSSTMCWRGGTSGKRSSGMKKIIGPISNAFCTISNGIVSTCTPMS